MSLTDASVHILYYQVKLTQPLHEGTSDQTRSMLPGIKRELQIALDGKEGSPT